LFWFGPYQEKLSAGRLVSLFTPERLLALPWVDGAGTTAALLDPTARPPSGDGHH